MINTLTYIQFCSPLVLYGVVYLGLGVCPGWDYLSFFPLHTFLASVLCTCNSMHIHRCIYLGTPTSGSKYSKFNFHTNCKSHGVCARVQGGDA